MNKQLSQLVNAWVQYAKINGLRPGTQKYAAAHHAFILGAKSLLNGELPPIVSVYVMTGRDIAEIPRILEEREAQAAA